MKKSVLLLVVMFLLIATTAMATTWSQQFQETGVGPFDKIEIFMMTPGVNFLPPTGQSGFSDASWAANLINPNYSVATGPSSTNLTWFISATDNTPFTFDFLAYNNNVIIDSASATFNPTNVAVNYGFTFDAPTFPNGVGYDRAPVPEPGTIMLLGAGFLGLAVYGKRRKSA